MAHFLTKNACPLTFSEPQRREPERQLQAAACQEERGGVRRKNLGTGLGCQRIQGLEKVWCQFSTLFAQKGNLPTNGVLKKMEIKTHIGSNGKLFM